jgi:amino acid adenylation domain-containing protein
MRMTRIDQVEHWRELLTEQNSLPQCFEHIAATYPARIALGSDTWRPTYAELNAAANRSAHALLGVGVSSGDRVAVLMQHDTPLIAAMLSVLKAGGVVVILSPDDPLDRLRQVVQDAGSKVVLADPTTRPLVDTALGSVCTVADFDHRAEDGPDCNPVISTSPDATAMLCYTSGSTGRPKALMMSHRLIIHNAARISQAMRLSANDRIASLGSLSMYSAVNTAWSALENGASLWPFAAAQRGITGLADWIADRDITIYVSSSSLFRHFMATLPASISFPRVRSIRLTAEAATSGDFRAFQQHFSDSCTFIHTLASSETGQIARIALKRSDVVPEGRLPVGYPADGVEVCLLDEAGMPVSDGAAGEIVIRSRYLFNGYWRNQELTANRLSGDPAGGELRRFRTGDFGRRRADGMLEYIGRSDAMLKIRGNRIELAEVESTIRGLPGIADVIVRPQQESDHEPQLVAYVVLQSGDLTSAAGLRAALRDVLPRHAVPSAFSFLDRFPTNAYGKIDISQLQPIRKPDRELAPDAITESETEQLLATIWSAEFNRQAIGRDDDFFDLGGDSLIAAVVAARIHEALGLEIPIGTFFDHPVLTDFARTIDALRTTQAESIVTPEPRASRSDPFPLSFGQEYYWHTSQRSDQPALHVATNRIRIVGPLNKDLLQECIDSMAQRHEMLRTSFDVANGQPVQLVQPTLSLSLAYHDFSTVPRATDKAEHLARELTTEPFDLARPPLVRLTLVRLGVNEHLLLKTHHHIVLDGWSWNIFFRELGRLYEARQTGQCDPGLDPPHQYGDYALWQRATFNPTHPRYRTELAWWIDHLLAAAHPDRVMYRQALVRCVRLAPALPRLVKKTIGAMLRDLCRVPKAARVSLPFKRAQAASGLDPAEGFLRVTISPDTSRRLSELGRQANATHFAVRLAAFAALLAAESGTPSVVVSTHFSTRNRAITRDLFGFCANHGLVTLNCDEVQSFRECVTFVRDRLAGLQSHGEFPYELLHRELQDWKVRLPQPLSLVGSATPHADIEFAGLRLSAGRPVSMVMQPGFGIKFERDGGADDCAVLFDAHVYDPVAVRAFMARLVRVLDVVSCDPDLVVGEALLRAPA